MCDSTIGMVQNDDLIEVEKPVQCRDVDQRGSDST